MGRVRDSGFRVSPGFNWFEVDEVDHGSILRVVVDTTLHCLRMVAKAKTGIIISSALLAYKFSRQLSFEGQEAT